MSFKFNQSLNNHYNHNNYHKRTGVTNQVSHNKHNRALKSCEPSYLLVTC